jgi:hypothetical protein
MSVARKNILCSRMFENGALHRMQQRFRWRSGRLYIMAILDRALDGRKLHLAGWTVARDQ